MVMSLWRNKINCLKLPSNAGLAEHMKPLPITHDHASLIDNTVEYKPGILVPHFYFRTHLPTAESAHTIR